MSAAAGTLKKLEDDAKELDSLMETARSQRVKSLLAAELKKVGAEMAAERERLATVAAASKPAATPSNSAATKPAYDVQVKNYSWDQSDKFVKIYLTGLNGVQSLPESGVSYSLTDTSVDVRVLELAGKNHCFSIRETCEKIVPDKSYIKIKCDMVSVFLLKAKQGQKWAHLRAVEKATAASKLPKIDADAGAGADPSASLMSMMKQMYDDGDDEMKRTIAKAWTQSRDKTGAEPDFAGIGGDL